jgi:hypothetical protein
MRLYKESPSADCELLNEMLTLDQVGIDGLPKNEVPQKVRNVYQRQTRGSSSACLWSWLTPRPSDCDGLV